MKKPLIFLLSCLAFLTSSAQMDDSLFIKRLSDEILSNSQAYENLRFLTKKIGARLAGSQGMVKSEKWGEEIMQKSGADKVWKQQCMVPHWVRGGKDEAIARQNNKDKGKALDVIALGNSIGSAKPVVANVIEVSDFEDLEKKKDLVKDRIVFYNYKFNPTFVHTFHSYRDAVKYRGQGPGNAAKYGAAAIIIRSMSHSTDNFPHTGSTRYDSNYARIPAVAVGLRDADWLSDAIKKNQPLFVIEAMRMETTIAATEEGSIVQIVLLPGSMVKSDDLVVVVK